MEDFPSRIVCRLANHSAFSGFVHRDFRQQNLVMKAVQIFVVVIMLAAARLHAQLVNDGATNTLSNVATNLTGDVTVGTNGSFTLLILSDNALLTNSLNGVIGRNATARSNTVQLVSSTARWQMGGSLFV